MRTGFSLRRNGILMLIPAILFLGTATTSVGQQTYYDVTAGNGNGVRFWSNDYYKIHMGSASEYFYGPVTDYSIKMNMNSTSGRGWIII
jgi:hypothetical protein